MGVGERAERAAQVVQLLLDGDRRLGRGAAGDEPVAVGGREPLAVERHLLGPAPAPVGVDAGVAGDLVDPRPEGDRGLGGADPAQRRDEDVLRDVLGARVVVDPAGHEAGDLRQVARVELLEGAVVAAPDGLDEGGIVRTRRVGEHSGSSLHHDYAHLDEPVPIAAGP